MGNKIAILSTAPLSSEVSLDGYVVVDVLQFISVAPIEENAKEVQALYGREIVAAFTSANAVEVLPSVESKPNWKVYCIGSATAKAVTEKFEVAAIVGTAINASALADQIINDGIKDVVFFCGDKRLDTLPSKLQGMGVGVDERVVYRTVETPVKVDKHYEGILFFSPSAVNSFFSMNEVAEDVVLFAIGDTTAKAISNKTSNEVVVCDTQSKDEVLRQAINYFQQKAA
jgi:uroporphyrinogen-III synthase